MAMPQVSLPTKEALLEAMELAKNSKEAADYLVTNFNAILDRAKIGNEADGLREQVALFAKNVGYQLDGNKDHWRGIEGQDTSFENMHANIAQEAGAFFEQIQTDDTKVELSFAINGLAQFLRGYSKSEDKKPKDEKSEELGQQLEGGQGGGRTA